MLLGAAALCFWQTWTDGEGQPENGRVGARTSLDHPQLFPYLRVSLDDVVLDPTFRAELLLAQEAAVLAHRVVPLQDKASFCSPKQSRKCPGGVAPLPCCPPQREVDA